MSEMDPNDAMREAARDALRELMPDLLKIVRGEEPPGPSLNGHSGNGSAAALVATADDVVPVVPAPPVAAIMRPSTWSRPAVPGEVIGDGGSDQRREHASAAVAPPPPGAANEQPAGTRSPDARVEAVTIDDDEDLESFVRALAARLENPRDRLAIRAGKLRFTLRRTAAPAPAGAGDGEAVRIEKGAVTERAVGDAAARGARLVLSPRAVLTPLARDKARSLGVQIEREGRC
jgi:hypothetical protein